MIVRQITIERTLNILVSDCCEFAPWFQRVASKNKIRAVISRPRMSHHSLRPAAALNSVFSSGVAIESKPITSELVVEIVFLRYGRGLSEGRSENGKARGCGLFAIRHQRRSVVMMKWARSSVKWRACRSK